MRRRQRDQLHPRRAVVGRGRRPHASSAKGLFDFGDNNGIGDTVRLQHALGVAYKDGKLFVADTYNSKIKILDPVDRSCTTFVGERAGKGMESTFNEPGGLSVAGNKLLRRRHQRPSHPGGRYDDARRDDAGTAGRRGAGVAGNEGQEVGVLSHTNPKRQRGPTIPLAGASGWYVRP